MPGIRTLVLDAWSALSYKQPLRDDLTARLNGWQARTWLPDRERRRLNAYMVLAAYDLNTAREFLAITDGDEDTRENREYGDASLVVDQVLAHLLGETQEIVVPGADDYDPDQDSTESAEADENPDDDAATDEGEVDVDPAEQARSRFLFERQEWLREWAEDVHLTLRLVDCERNAVQYGDGVWLLGWDERKQRTTAAVMDPGFYFPVLPDSIDGYDYPDRVHFAWELPADDFPDNKTRLRRLTYEVRPLRAVIVEDPDTGEITLEPPPNATVQSTGDGDEEVSRWVRQYAWDPEPSELACYLTDATWVLDDLDDADHFDRLDMSKARFARTDDGREIRDLDLEIDFLPVVHEPNTVPGGQHFGQSSLSRVLQILDDLQNADTDAQSASATTGSPIIGVHGSKVPQGDPTDPRNRARRLPVEPGALWDLGENGGMDVADTSQQLAELREYVGSLRDRLAVNSRLPAAILGTVKPSEVPSGYAMQLSFGPLTAMMRQMRLTRAVKHPLLLKMVQRLAMANGALDGGEVPPAEIRLGAYLPADKAGTLDLVTKGLEAHVISLETAVAMLLDAGFPIDEVRAEIERIQERDYEAANALADATGDQAAVNEFLGLEPPEPTVQPVPPVPPAVPNTLPVPEPPA